MHVSPRPISPLVENDLRLRASRTPLLAFALYALLAIAGTILLSERGTAVGFCEDLAAACPGP